MARDGRKKIRIEVSAGGIVFQKTRRGIELAMILDPFRKWTFPKGHVEAGETPVRAAMRETREEIGLKRVRHVAPLGTMDFWFNRDVLVHKFVHYFLFESGSGQTLKPQSGELIKDAQWVSVREALRRSGYKNMGHILQSALRMLRHI